MKNNEEYSLMRIKYRTYKKCKKQIITGIILLGVGFFFEDILSISFFMIIMGVVLTTSSFFGILSNRLTKTQIDYLKDEKLK